MHRSMRFFRLAPTLALLVTIGGCYTKVKPNADPDPVTVAAPDERPALPPDHPPIRRGDDYEPPPATAPSIAPSLDRNNARARWREMRIRDYSYRIRTETRTFREEFTVDVVGGNVAGLRDYTGNGYPPYPSDVPTINGWFDALWNDGGEGARYDPNDGHPVFFRIGRPGTEQERWHTILWLESY
jgi:hypothetical protein